MTRWQERGEVLDSEDDEDGSLSLASRYGSQERAAKRLRLDDGDGDAVFQKAGIEVFGRPGWDGNEDRLADGTDPRPNSDDSDDSDGLPDVRDILTRRESQPLCGNAVESPSLAPSSPLSERDTTPEAPTFNLQALQTGLGANISRQRDSLSATQAVMRRNLRTRKEVQLHPYLLDKAKYQALCKARGIKPVRMVDVSQNAGESQDLSSDDAPSSPTSSRSPGISPIGPSSELGESMELFRSVPPELPREQSVNGIQRHDANSDQRDLPEPSQRSRRLPAVRLPTRDHEAAENFADEFSIPPSPPLTSSSSPTFKALPSGFRIPGRLATTPLPLPTPQISSEARQVQDGNSDSDRDSAVQTSRKGLASARQRRQAINAVVVRSSSDSSDSASEVQATHAYEERKLRREKRRIRGVLPASWLKLDLKAQQVRSTTSISKHYQAQSSSPSPRRERPKGVAKVVAKSSNRLPSTQALVISDDDSDVSVVSAELRRPVVSPQQTRLQLQSNAVFGLQRNSVMDDEDMEVDWVDPMLPKNPRERRNQSPRTRRQPRIRDAFQRVRDTAPDFSEEKRARDVQSPAGHNAYRPKQTRRRRQSYKPTTPLLSILDAPRSPREGMKTAPQFIRLARRLARASKNSGRTSPKHKVIRLATDVDTIDARCNLDAWREGTLAPRESSHPATSHQRRPLSEVSPNKRQQSFPSPSGRSSQSRNISKKWSASTRTPRLQQTQLKATQNFSTTQAEQQIQSPAQHGRQELPQQRPWRVHTRPTVHRSAQLESLEDCYQYHDRSTLLERRVLEMIRSKSLLVDTSDGQVQRHDQCLPVLGFDQDNLPQQQHLPSQPQDNNGPHPKPGGRPVRQRKHLASRLDVDARRYRQPSEPLPDANIGPKVQQTSIQSDHEVLQGLGPFGTRYTTDFDLKPLELGTYFHESTFIGSGEFEDALKLTHRNLDVSSGRLSIHVEGAIYTWAAWTEEVSAELSHISNAIGNITRVSPPTELPVTQSTQDHADIAEQTVEYLLRSVVRYLSKCLSFIDPIDRQPCVSRLLDVQDTLMEFIAEGNEEIHSLLKLRCLTHTMVLAKEALTIADHPLVQLSTRTRCQMQLHKVATRLSNLLTSRHLQDLRTFYEDNHLTAVRETGIRGNRAALSCAVVLYHTLYSIDSSTRIFWETIIAGLYNEPERLYDVQAIDRIWYDLVSIQPCLEFDVKGVARVGSRLLNNPGGWNSLKTLLARLFNLYDSTSKVPGSTVNEYMRATLCRCDTLVARWGWWQCESMLTIIFDFFARHGLALLYKEDGRGSPHFLSSLAKSPNIDTSMQDPSFTTFLKLIVVATRQMRKHNDKKIGSIVWRLIPNHGRTYPKESEVRQVDLDALRNHHDLLSTLYYASPPSSRPRLELLRNLVDHKTSHREACRISVRAWANLANFQVSTNEPSSSLEPFIAWFDDTLKSTMAQFRLARSEAEHQFAIVKAQGVSYVTQDLLESTIASNQRQIAATLTDCLAALKNALLVTSNFDTLLQLATGSQFWQIFDLFDPSQRRVEPALVEALEVVQTIVMSRQKFAQTRALQESSEESQEYGDMSDLFELAELDHDTVISDHIVIEELHQSVWRVVSNVFGADTAADEALLLKIVETWVELAQYQVASGKSTWESYLGSFSSTSWTQLRETVHRRRYTPYFFARVIQCATTSLQGLQSTLLATWLSSLVEREAALKFQHILTTAMLNHVSHDVLHNLPFACSEGGEYRITLPELRQRRMALLSTVLANMRESSEQVARQQQAQAQSLRKTYSDMLRHMMHAMKSNYRSLQPSAFEDVASTDVQGAYVDFVHQVVSYLQQYTTDICAVDRFFTDSTAFPLPANDPSYVVGRLKSYEPKLHEARSRKQLAVFVLAVCERAAVDGQQHYLKGQLIDAVDGAGKFAIDSGPGLCQVLFTSIFPAYLEHSLASSSAWIMAGPILQACSAILARFRRHVAWEDHASVRTSVATVGCLLQSCLEPLRMIAEHVRFIDHPHALRIIGDIFHLVQSSLTLAEYLMRSDHGNLALQALVSYFHMLGESLHEQLQTSDNNLDARSTSIPQPIHGEFADTLSFARDQVTVTLNNDWYALDGRYFVRRGAVSKEVEVDLLDAPTERELLLETLSNFRSAYRAIFDPRGQTKMGDAGSFFECVV